MHSDKKDLRFDKRASKYDGLEGRLSRRFYRLLLNQVKLFPGAIVLDVGCGTGTMLRKMADIYQIDGYGIDMEENMIAEARKKCPEMTIQISKCENMPFNDQSFDVITACMAYHHFSNQEGFAREASRIIKPGGYLYIADPHLPAIIRKPLNGIIKQFHIAAYIGTSKEISDDFQKYGFIPDGFVTDGYAQVVTLKRISYS